MKDKLILAGLLYGSGNFVGKNKNSIAIYLSPKSEELISNIKKELPFFSSTRTIEFNNKKIFGVYFSLRTGKELKKLYDFNETHIQERILPDSICNLDIEDKKIFFGSWFSTSCVVKRDFFFRQPKIHFFENSKNLINKAQNTLKELGIESKEIDNSNRIFKSPLVQDIIKKNSELVISDKNSLSIFLSEFKLLNPTIRDQIIVHL